MNPKSRTLNRWSEDFRIIGIIDYRGVVYSVHAKFGEDHDKHFGWRMNKCWDYDPHKKQLYYSNLNVEDIDRVERHIRRKWRSKINKILS